MTKKLDKNVLIENVYALADVGYQFTPLRSGTKKPFTKDWLNVRFTLQEVVREVERLGANVGMLNGEPSGWTVDLDVDMPEALDVAPRILPATSAIFGRDSNPDSHFVYRVPSGSSLAVVRHKLGQKTLAEFRGAEQTAIPGSLHPTGELYVGDITDPALVDLSDLQYRFGMLCSITALRKYYPLKGSRHDFIFGLTGRMAQGNYPSMSGAVLIDVLMELVGDDEHRDREDCIVTAYEKIAEGQVCAGKSLMRQFMPEATVSSVERYLGLTQAMVRYPGSSLATIATPNAIAVQMPGLKITKNNEIKSTRHNAKVLLESDAAWDGALALNLRSDRVELIASPPFDVDGTLPIPVGGTVLLQICDWLSTRYGHDAPAPTVMEALRICAYANRYDPVADYLRRCGDEWDGAARLDEMLTRFFATADTPYTSMVGSKWMISAVARAIEPGCKVDHTLVLEGGQGAGKSSAFAILGGKYYAEDPPSLIANNGKEFQEWCQGPWIAEFAELEAMRRSEATQVKAVLTATTDRYRASYGSSVEEHPRRFVFAATTNESEYLRDGTGGRRFWPVFVEGTIDLKGLADARDQLWGEAYVRQQAREPHWLTTDEEVNLAKAEQEKRMVRDALEDNILEAAEFCAKGKGYAIGPELILEIETGNGLPALRSPGNIKERIGKVLKLHGWDYTRRRIDGKLTRIYVPPVKDDDCGYDQPEHRDGMAPPDQGSSAPGGGGCNESFALGFSETPHWVECPRGSDGKEVGSCG